LENAGQEGGVRARAKDKVGEEIVRQKEENVMKGGMP